MTHLEDIPFADCFNVEDRFVLTPTGDGGLKLHISLEMRWIKNTMWKVGALGSGSESGSGSVSG